MLIGKNTTRAEPTAQEIQKMYDEDELPPYYVNGPNSARVDIVSAISLLSQYCNSLPCDKYTTFAPELFYEQSLQGLRVTIVMPTICPITEPITVSITHGQKAFLEHVYVLICARKIL